MHTQVWLCKVFITAAAIYHCACKMLLEVVSGLQFLVWLRCAG